MKAKGIFKLILLVLMLGAACACMFMANTVQTSENTVTVSEGKIATRAGKLSYKLYKPNGVSETNKAPAVLLLHGYQNDHETCAAYSIELSRRGYVVLALDEYGHGSSKAGLFNRGYVDHKVTVNYGNDSVQDGTYVDITGPGRYKLMMNFSNLSFFDDHYSKDSHGNAIIDSSCGGIDAYKYLSELPYVDNQKMALSGHSMGTWSSWSVAAAYAGTPIQPVATVLQCGELFRDSVYDPSIRFNNVLLLQAKYDEFSYFRDYAPVVSDALLKTPLRCEFLGTSADKAAWNTTYGNFADGTARRMELLYTNHRLTTHNAKGLSVALDWFDQACGHRSSLPYDDLTAMNKEWLTLGAMLLTLLAMFPLMSFLLEKDMFIDLVQPIPDETTLMSRKARWGGALFTVFIAGLSFPFMTQLGHGLLPLPENIFCMTVGNGFLSWYGFLILVMAISNLISAISRKRKGLHKNAFIKGFAGAYEQTHIDWVLFCKALILSFLLTGMVYLVNWIFTLVFHLDLRIIWPFFRPFTGARFLQFLVYFPVFVLFYMMNNSKIFASFRSKASYRRGLFAFLSEWIKNFFLMAGGVLIIVLLEYIPFFLDISPGADLLFGSTFGGPFMSLLILFVPQILFFSLIGTFCYRKTHNVFTGAFIIAILACWIVTGGSSML
ncbi:MAG: hypothetical protein IIZ28_04225 [Erysipelotrichaceae bacterium]|nr:hypothetical protein [Erysipelotrichaceae bacterium]